MPGIQPNAQYNVAAAGSLPVRIAAHQRRKMFSRFMLDTGVTAEAHPRCRRHVRPQLRGLELSGGLVSVQGYGDGGRE